MPVIAISILASVVALAPPADRPATVDGLGHAVPGASLEAMRGGDSTVVTVTADNDGSVEGNTATGTVGGQNIVTGGAFGNAAGISTVIQNSGANVLIQNGTAVNVQFGGGP